MAVDANTFYYEPPTHQDKIDNLLRKAEEKMTHHEKQVLDRLRTQSSENKVLDYR